MLERVKIIFAHLSVTSTRSFTAISASVVQLPLGMHAQLSRPEQQVPSLGAALVATFVGRSVQLREVLGVQRLFAPAEISLVREMGLTSLEELRYERRRMTGRSPVDTTVA